MNVFNVPKFSIKDDPDLWLYRYCKAARMNKWSETIMLDYVDNCFKQDLQKWFMNQNFKTWSQFDSAFRLKFTKKVNLEKIVSNIINIKMGKDEGVMAYMERFDQLRTKYLVQVNRTNNKTASNDPGRIESENPAKSNTPSKVTPSDDEANDSEVEFMITDTGFLKYFIKGITAKDMKRFLKTERPDSLEQAYEALKDVYGSDEDSSDEEIDFVKNGDYNDTSSDEEIEIEAASKSKNKSQRSNPTNKGKENEMSSLINEFKNMTLLLGELVNNNNNKTTTVKNKKTTCWNCNTNEHLTRDCDKPCKYCQSTGHKHYQCSLHKKNQVNAPTKKPISETMLMEEVFISEKRKIGDDTVNIDSQENSAKRNVRVTRSGKEVNSTPLKIAPKQTIKLDQTKDVVMQEVTPKQLENSRANNISNIKEVQLPKHPLLPLRVPNKVVNNETTKSNIDSIVDKIMKEKVHQFSLSELAELSPAARARLKSLITKPQVNKSAKSKPTGHAETVFLTEVSGLPKGKSAPRTYGFINGVRQEVIIDGGSTSFIISLNFAKQLGIREAAPADTSLMFGDGKTHYPIGLIQGLQVKVGASRTVSIDALCYDVGDKYNFIIGREGMHFLRLGTDWDTHFWYVKTDNGVVPLDIFYTKNGTVRDESDDESDNVILDDTHDVDGDYYIDQDDDEEAFIIMESYDDDDDDIVTEETKDTTINSDEQRFGELITKIRNIDDINEEDKDKLTEIVIKYKDCFGTGYDHLTQTNLLKFHVDTGSARPVYKRPYPFLSFSEKEMLKKDLEEMVQNGILVPTTHVPGNSKNSGWSFPCRYVKKKTGDYRLVTNFKDLNAVTVRDTWPLPNVVDVIESLAGAKWFSVIDLLKAFQQIAVEEESIPKLTIATPWGNYSYKCVPFGVLNGPSCFSRCVYMAIQPFLNDFATNYLDDVCLYGNDKFKHLENIELFLARMREVNLKINANKCDFFQKKIELLGFSISEDGIAPLASKVDKIQNFPRPINETGIRAFVNLCGFYRRHIPGFADITAPMNSLLKKNTPFIWSEDCEKSFCKLKQALVNAFTLTIPDANTRYNLYCDASEVGIGACLSTIVKDGSEKPVVFLSRKLLPAETRNPTVEKELLAVIYALRKLRKYLLDREFTLYCDNTAVCYLFNKNEPSQRLQRWVMCAQEFTFKIKHLPSTKNSVADALSRFPPKEYENREDGEYCIDALYEHLMVEVLPSQYETWLHELVFYFQNPGNAHTSNATKRLSLKYAYADQKLYRRVGARYVLIPTFEERPAILNEVHEGHGHFGINASWARLYKEYWWPNCYCDLTNHIKTCRECQLFSNPVPNLATERVPVHYLFEQFALDFVGPLPKTNKGNTHILVAIEAFSR